MKDSEYRNCCLNDQVPDGADFKYVFSKNCPYAYQNQYGIWCCNIDGIVQVHFFGCVPNETRKLLDWRNQ